MVPEDRSAGGIPVAMTAENTKALFEAAMQHPGTPRRLQAARLTAGLRGASSCSK
jgi:hypothetical protein